ncbi:MFS transporter [Rathayibacter sp. ZW T2_19]|uniref:MFS transporter n=1 Tax=Rathayibacter rubneri TaxID=2950106 RepID=A0A9X2DUA8_9MICO|nr:MFS transporter [Rathayibacter rubneri]MCM6761210.1 MFS transporter [Rathayibacter rubneri]
MTLVFLNSSSVSVAVPALTRQFSAGPVESEWIVYAFMFSLSVMILPFGRMSDMVGRRAVYLFGLGFFTLVSLLCGLAWSAPVLIALRVAQGVAAAAIITNITGQLTDVFRGAALGRALGYNMMFVSAANVLGPVVGGALVETLGWRALFWFNVPIGLLGVWWAVRTLRQAPPAAAPGYRFDWGGAALSVLMMGSVLLAVGFGSRWGWASPAFLGCAAVFVVTAVSFAVLERRLAHPLVATELVLGSRLRWMSLISGFFAAMPQSAVVVVVALYFQVTNGANALEAGLQVVPLAIGIIVIGPVSGRMINRVPARIQGALGAAAAAIGLGGLIAATVLSAVPLAFGGALFVAGLGIGLFTPSNTAAIMAGVPAGHRGSVNGTRLVAHNFGLTLGTAIALTALASQLSPLQQDAAYSGDSVALRAAGAALVNAFAVSFGALLLATIAQGVTSVLRGSGVGDEPLPSRSEL